MNTLQNLPADLLDMLTYMRPAGSKAEEAFIERFLKPLNPYQDDYGNHWVQVGQRSRTLWSSHTDTVHTEGGRQRVKVSGGLMTAPESNCLGADCTAGVWLMVQMIKRGVEGLYCFHREEEIGAKGSTWAADNWPDMANTVDHVIAFDRRGYDSIITHQMGGRTCSDAFATALGDALGMRPDDTGSFTDSQSYAHLVPECTNVSVGYFGAHTKHESQDWRFLVSLLEKLCVLDTSILPVERDPTVADYGNFGSWGRTEWDYWDDHGDTNRRVHSPYLYDLVRDHPDVASDLLEQLGIDATAFLKALGETQRIAA